MQKQILSQVKHYAKQNVRRSLWRGLVRVVACILVFCTTYALILPALTLEIESVCAQEEHVHSQECYAQVTSREVTNLACSYETLAVHRHTNACYDAEGLPRCGSADYIVHEHSGACWEDEVLVCALPEIRQHEHTDACYEQPESHEHTEVCYAAGETLICTEEETGGHTHTAECEELVQVCEQTVETHIHTDGCYSQAECPIPEDETHTHTDACMGKELVCQLTEQPHEHGEDCFAASYICGRSEEPAHVHEEDCYEQTLACGQEETAQSAESTQVLVCTEEEILLHTHTDSCYSGDEARVLICGRLEVLCHDHTENCFVSETVAVDTENLTCLLTEEEGHTHTDRCYGTWELVCEQEEHTHTEGCFSEAVLAAVSETEFAEADSPVDGIITLDTSMEHGGNMDVEWNCASGNVKPLTVYVSFNANDISEKSITIQVPSGFKIKSYSATEDTAAISGVEKLPIGSDYEVYIDTVELKPASVQGNIVGITNNGTWADQKLTGYTGIRSVNQVSDRGYGGDIVYTLVPETNTVEITIKLEVHQELLSHTVNREALEEPIRIISQSAAGEVQSTITVAVTDIPRAGLTASSATSANIVEESGMEGRSEVISISSGTWNHLSDHQQYSFFDSAQVCLTYPEGVFLEPDTVTCGVFGYEASNPITELQNNEEKEVVSGHLSVLWSEGENGGGTITWYMEKGTWHHFNMHKMFGADFRANTNIDYDDDTIKFSIELVDYQRNGLQRKESPINFTRKLVSKDGDKNITLIPYRYIRRDITWDFFTPPEEGGYSANYDAVDHDYVLGGINVYTALAYNDNTFCFENPDGLKITALNLMGHNARDIVIVTNYRTITLASWVETGEGNVAPEYGGQYSANLLRLRDIPDITIWDDEYIKTCLFTVDLNQHNPYAAARVCGSFTYIGQFQDGNNDGNRDGDVVLRMLRDGTTYEQYQTAQNPEELSELTYKNGSPTNPVIATDHTKIGWTNTGVGGASTTVVSADTNKAKETYQSPDRLAFSSAVFSGMNIKTQDMIIDPVLVISLPQGIDLDETSVKAKSAAGIFQGAEVELEKYGEIRQTEINGVIWNTYRFGVKKGQELALIAEEAHMGTRNGSSDYKITATFEATVDPACPAYNLSLKDVVMWDVRNTGRNDDTLTGVPASGVSGDALYAAPATPCVDTDSNNFLGYGTAYNVAVAGDTFAIQPLPGLEIDLGIKSVADKDSAMTAADYVTYNGTDGSTVPLRPGRYADVMLTYKSTSNTDFFAGSVLYVPIPKKGVDYANYFENVNLKNPTLNENPEYMKTFGFSMALTGPVSLQPSSTNGSDKWMTLYALGTVSSNPESRPNISEESGKQDNWEPVVQNGGEVNWLTAAQVGNRWAEVTMMKFVAQDDVAPGETGTAIMRLQIHDVSGVEDPTRGGTYNYWRSYGKAVTSETLLTGNWKYSSVIAATPAVETVTGQIFVDADRNGRWDSDEQPYSSGIYTVELSKVGGGMNVRLLTVQDDGSFALLNSDGVPDYLSEGTYTVTVHRNADPDFGFANTDFDSSVGKESPESEWHNNVTGSDVYATWTFEVTNTGTDGTVVHRVGIGVKATVTATIEGVKTFQGGTLEADAFSFLLKPLDDAPVDETSASNDANGNFSFGTIVYEGPGTYTYEITEDASNPRPGIHYDSHTATVTVTVTEDPQTGILSVQVSYDNSGAARDNDRARTDKAAFTNAVSYELPNTGGMGTTLFYLLGGIMALAAVVLLVHRKRRSAP